MALIGSIGTALLAALPEEIGAAAWGAAGGITEATGLAVTAPELVGTAAVGAGVGGMAGADAKQQAAAKAADAQRGAANTQQAGAVAPGLAPAAAPAPMAGLAALGSGPQKTMNMKAGGKVPLGDGAYIVPADVVSALGNGSSKAGAEFLRRLMDEVKNQATHRQGLGAAKKHVEENA